MTAKQLEQETGCKIMVRGKGSMRDKKKVRQHTIYHSPRSLYATCSNARGGAFTVINDERNERCANDENI
jgi:hypothetical protein